MSTTSADDLRRGLDVDDGAGSATDDNDYGARESNFQVDGQLQAPLNQPSAAAGTAAGTATRTGTDHQTTPQRPKRIKASTRERALRTALVDRYVGIYNEAVRDLRHNDSFLRSRARAGDDIQIGVVTWTPRERDALFRGLARYGKGEPRRIAAFIGPSKSEMEVRAYVQLLHDSWCARLTSRSYPKLMNRWALPAAIEVSEEVGGAVEKSARAMVEEQDHQERIVGKRRYGELYRIDSGVAEWIEKHTKKDSAGNDDDDDDDDDDDNTDNNSNDDNDGHSDKNDAEVRHNQDQQPLDDTRDQSHDSDGSCELIEDSSMFTVARLFHISRWIHLSERMFMNSGQEKLQDNWWNITGGREPPALTCEAFADFYALAISIMRRLIQSAMFMSMARIRSLAHASDKVTNSVTKEDVLIALDLLKMPRNAAGFWPRVSRRHSLEVLDVRNRKGWKPVRLSHDQVEKSLLRKRKADLETVNATNGTAPGESDVNGARRESDDEHGDTSEDESFTSSGNSDDETESLDLEQDGLERDITGDDEDEDADDGEEAYVHYEDSEQFSDKEELKTDSVDAHASWQEDLRLRKLLGLEINSSNSIGPEMDEPAQIQGVLKSDIESGDDSETEERAESTEQDEVDEDEDNDNDDDDDGDANSRGRPVRESVSVRPSKEDLLDWRDRLLYFAEWEQFGPETPYVMTQLDRRKKRRME